MKQAGLFGGTFDPVHNAHLAFAHAALDALGLDEVRWVPAGQPWQKARDVEKGHAITPALHRVTMLELALAGEPRFVLDRIELAREGPSYTLDTIKALRAAEPAVEWTLLVGQDQFARLHTWRGWEELLSLVRLAVARRPGPLAAPDPAVQRAAHRVVPLPLLDIAASDIRTRVAQARDISQLVPPEVAGYIAKHGLYRPPDRS